MRCSVASSFSSGFFRVSTTQNKIRGRYKLYHARLLLHISLATMMWTMMIAILAMMPVGSASVPATSMEQDKPQDKELPWVGTRPEPLTPAQREAKLQETIERQKLLYKDEPRRKDDKLFDLLQGWDTLYEQEGKTALPKWYSTAKREVFTLEDTTGSPECEDGDVSGEELDMVKKTLLLDFLQKWNAMYEEDGRDALFDWYKMARFSVFEMPKFESVYGAEYETDPNDLFYLNDQIDSQHGAYLHLMEYFECYDRPGMPVDEYNNEEIWLFLRHLYVGIVGAEKSTLKRMNGFGFEVPVRFAFAEEKGRGVYAVEDIPENTLVTNSSVFCAQFDSGADYRKFIASLPPNLACDMLMWSYGHNKDHLDPSTLRIAIDLDGGGMMNDSGYYDGEDGETNNLKRLFQGKGGIYVASRDIQAGEELQMAYSSFSTRVYRWEYFGLE